jgi:hypothetical protein
VKREGLIPTLPKIQPKERRKIQRDDTKRGRYSNKQEGKKEENA